MYETQTFETILARALGRVSGNVDKREGSIIYDALAPACIELAQLYTELDVLLRLAFANTSSGDYLRRRCAERGIVPREATAAIRLGMFDVDVPIGSRFRIADVVYGVTERITFGQFKLQAETKGAVGNGYFGELLPIDYVEGMTSATLADVLVPGRDDETDAELFARFDALVRKPATSGNSNHYKQWALEVQGVGDARVIPVWNGPLTVKVVLVTTERRAPNASLVSTAAAYIESQRPIGASVTTVGATETAINVSAQLTLSGVTLAAVKVEFESKLLDYLKSLVFTSQPVRYTKIASLLSECYGVVDYQSLLVNGSTGNVSVSVDAIAVKGTVTLI